MTYFLEFHTPRGVFTSVPQTSVSAASIICQYEDGSLPIRVPSADGGKICLTTDMIRQTVLVTREAE